MREEGDFMSSVFTREKSDGSFKMISKLNACARTMDQQCRLVQPLKHQTKCSYRYFREYECMFRIVFYHCYNKSGLIIRYITCVKVASV